VSADLPSLDWGEQRLFGELVEVVTGVFDPGAQLPDERRTVEWYLTALHRRDAFIAAWERYFDGYDALVLPPAQTTAFAHDATGYDRQGYSMVFANLAGLPALTIPARVDDEGLPVGIQLVGPRWSESRLLDIAAALEDADILPGFTRPPGY
jgi:amidase